MTDAGDNSNISGIKQLVKARFKAMHLIAEVSFEKFQASLLTGLTF